MENQQHRVQRDRTERPAPAERTAEAGSTLRAAPRQPLVSADGETAGVVPGVQGPGHDDRPGRCLQKRNDRPASSLQEGELEKALAEALEAAFPTYEALQAMVYYEMNANLEVLAGRGPLRGVCLRLIQQAAATDDLETLLRCARADNPRNRRLLAVEEMMRKVPGSARIESGPAGLANTFVLDRRTPLYDPARVAQQELRDPMRQKQEVTLPLQLLAGRDLVELTAAIAEALGVPTTEIRILAVDRGSVRLLISGPAGLGPRFEEVLAQIVWQRYPQAQVRSWDALTPEEAQTWQQRATHPAAPATPDLGIAFWESVRRQQVIRGDSAGLARTDLELGRLYTKMGQALTAWEQYQAARQGYAALGDQAGLGATLVELGNLATAHGATADARRFYEQALLHQQAIGDEMTAAQTKAVLAALDAQVDDEARQVAGSETGQPPPRPAKSSPDAN